MTGFLTPTTIALAQFTLREQFPLDTNPATGQPLPLQESVDFSKLSLIMNCAQNALNHATVAGTIYYSQFNIGQTYTPTPRGSTQSLQSFTLNGIGIPIGTTGGTDNWIAALYNSAGVVVGLSAVAGTLVGTASTIQQFNFLGSTGAGAVTPVTVQSGTYYLALQSNGTTATFKSINSPIWPWATGSQAGAFGTLAAITPPATFTQNLGPQAFLY